MTKLAIIIALMLGSFSLFAQQTVGGKVLKNSKDQTYNRGERKGSDAVDDALDKVEDKLKNIFKKKDKKKKDAAQDDSQNSVYDANPGQSSSSSTKKSSTKSNKKNSKFDFEPGQKQLGFDDFSTTSLGDFPLGWNTNSSAQITTLDDNNQKWLSMTKDGYFQPEFITNMPDNFTLEFEIFTRYKSSNVLDYRFFISPSKNPKKDLANHYPENYFQFSWTGCSQSAGFTLVEKDETISSNNALVIPELSCNDSANEGAISKFSIWRQDARLRIYINENKVIDLPRAFDAKQKYNVFKIGARYMNFANGRENDDEFMIANIRYAVAGEDNRSKLITEGRFVTNGILFDTNSDSIKPESGTVLKEIAATLTENPTVKVKIIGHTDSDGDVNANLELSKKRATAVKTALSSFYDIEASRMETDGKGESQALNQNTNPTEKAQNRRVEFIKL
jgi:outer membrane protein OmpA-like peptidoglycan-associated protein